MTQTIPNPEPARPVPVPYLDCERLDCYRVAVEFQAIAARIGSNRRLGALRDQLDRASVSIVLNLAEGAGRRTLRDKANFFTIARGSATESAAVLDLLLARGFVSLADHRHARGLLIRVVQMLTRLVAELPQLYLLCLRMPESLPRSQCYFVTLTERVIVLRTRRNASRTNAPDPADCG